MGIKSHVGSFLGMFGLVFVVNVAVTFLYSLIAHGQGAVDWASSVRTGIIVGIILTWVIARQKRKQED